MYITFGGYSDIGNVRKTNQDSLFIKIANIHDNHICIGAVCDGVGSMQNGELASVVSTLLFRQWFDEVTTSGNCEYEELKTGLINRFNLINQRIAGYCRRNNIQTASTVSVILMYDNQYFIVHIGDSRIYKADSQVYQLTVDHTITCLKNRGKAQIEKKMLTQCVGLRNNLSIFCAQGWVKENDVFLLCSDGFHNKMKEDEILHLTKKISIRTNVDMVAHTLVRKVRKRHENDNISVGIIKMLP